MFMSILMLGGSQNFQRTTSFGSLSVNLKNYPNFVYIYNSDLKFFLRFQIFNYYYYFAFHMDGSHKFDNYWFNFRHFFSSIIIMHFLQLKNSQK
jgi:hypothetical protein